MNIFQKYFAAEQMLTPNLEVRDGERPHRRCAALLLSQPGHLVLLHLYPVIDQPGLLQLPDLCAEPAVQIIIKRYVHQRSK